MMRYIKDIALTALTLFLAFLAALVLVAGALVSVSILTNYGTILILAPRRESPATDGAKPAPTPNQSERRKEQWVVNANDGLPT